MDVPVKPGDPLSQPTRARVFALLGELHQPATTEELAAQLQLHPNGVRIHLERLLEAGLIERRRERLPRGRPRDTWAISADAQPGGDPPTAYAELARWLVRAIAARGTEAAEMEASGRVIGRGLAGEHGRRHGSEQALFDTLTALGFQPQREPAAGRQLTYTLRNCPYREAVRERQPLICALHRGLTGGLLAELDPESRLESFEPKDPELAGCVIRMRGEIARMVPRQSGPASQGGGAR